MYKLLNIFILKLFTAKLCSLLRICGNPKTDITQGIFFDFTHNTTHLGDRLFFVPLFIFLNKNKIPIFIKSNDSQSIEVYSHLKLKFRLIENGIKFDNIFILAPSLLSFFFKYKNFFLIDLNDTSCKHTVSNQINNIFIMLFNLPINNTCIHKFNSKNSFFNNKKNKYYIFNNYIDSGFFRKLFVSEDKLIQKCLYLKKNKFKIIHMGSKNDRILDKNKYPFVDIDLRGKKSISEVINYFRYKNIVGVVSYDNFYMHLAGLFNKKSFILFRGRLLRKNLLHHYNFINTTLSKEESDITYL